MRSTPSDAPMQSPQPVQPTPPPTTMRQTSRDSLSSSSVAPVAAPPVARLHTSVPAPEEDDMAPQNVSFISADDNTDDVDNASSEAALKAFRRRAKQILEEYAASSNPYDLVFTTGFDNGQRKEIHT